MPRKLVTLQTIADKLGITKVSVSKALKNQPGVSAKLKRRVIEVAMEVGYISPNKSSDMDSAPSTFGFVVPTRFFLSSDAFYTKIYYEISRLSRTHHINVRLFIVDAHDEEHLASLVRNGDEMPDGFFLVGNLSDLYIECIKQLGRPCMAIDFYKPHQNMDCVITDNFYSSYLLTTYLIDRGHRDIGFLGSLYYSTSVTDRYWGYRKALSEYGLNYVPEWNLNNTDSSGVYFTEIALPNTLPTAFVCHCDMAAYHLMLVLQRHNIKIPEDISLVSFDNTLLSENMSPPLTSVNIDTTRIASEAFKLLQTRIQHSSAPPQRLILSTNIVERKSVVELPGSLSPKPLETVESARNS